LRGAALTVQTEQRREVILSGPARAAKTFGILYKLHHLAETIPGCRFLILRKTRESLSESALATFELDVIPADHFVLQGAPQRKNRDVYLYENGSQIVVGGFRQSGKDQTEKIMSTEWDLIYVNEAPELSLDEWQKLTTRLTRFKLGYSQIIGDMNPPPPSHWTWKRQQEGKLVIHRAQLIDNPRWWQNGQWTVEGLQVYDTLSSLVGNLRARLFLGESAAFEGMVYDNFSAEDWPIGNLTDDEPDLTLPFELACDDGFIDPRAILLIQRQPTRILIFDELYHRKHLEEVCIREAIELFGKHYGWQWLNDKYEVVPAPSPEEAEQRLQAGWSRSTQLPEIAIVSHEAPALHRRFRNANIPARVGVHKIIDGIPIVRQLFCDGQGYRAVAVHRRCKNIIEEVTAGYRYAPEGSRRDEEEPLDENNHAADAFRTWVWARAKN